MQSFRFIPIDNEINCIFSKDQIQNCHSIKIHENKKLTNYYTIVKKIALFLN